VEVVEIDQVDPQALQGTFAGLADMLWASVDATGLRHESELGRQHDLVAALPDGRADLLLGVSVPVRRVDERLIPRSSARSMTPTAASRVRALLV
jgi:hypothetical protein